MATKDIGLSMKLQFDGSQAMSGMRKTNSAFARMAMGAKRVKAGMQNLRTGFRGSNILTAALGAGIVKTVKDFAKFDFQVTKAISLTKDGATNMDKLRKFAKKMGAETFFTAIQAAEGMEALARAGLKTVEITAALPKVLQLAAAESLDLKRATEIVVKASNQFGISMKRAGNITDIFAFVSKNTATDVNQLAEGLKFVGTKAGRSMNITMKQTVGVLGLLSNVAADASVGGTVLNNALIKIGQNAKRGRVKIGRFSAEIVKTFDKKTGKRGVDLVATMKNIATTASKIQDPIKRSAALTKLLGIRGEKAALAFTAAFGKDKIKSTTEFLTKLKGNLTGATKALADAQINTVAGQYKIFTSALSGVSIGFGKMLIKGTPLVPFMQRMTKVLGSAAEALSLLSSDNKHPKGLKATAIGLAKLDKTGVSLALGLKEGFKAVKEVLSTVKGILKSVGSAFGINFGKTQLNDVIRIGAKTLAWAGVLKTTTNIMGRLAAVSKGAFQIIRGGLGIAATAGGGLLKALSARVPLLARLGAKLPGVGGALARAIGGVEKITAQPVRVVNFDEAGGGLGVATGGAGIVGAAAGFVRTTSAATAAAGGLNSLSGALGAKAGGLVFAALAAGAGIGALADRMFGISDKLSTAALKRQNDVKKDLRKAREPLQDFAAQIKNLQTLQKLQTGGKKAVGFGGKKVALTREFAESRLRAQLSAQGKKGKAQDEIVKNFAKMLSTFPTKEEFLAKNKNFKIENVIKLDGKVIARNVAVRTEEQDQRLGRKSVPGKKRLARTK